jgi:hypothetical protein
MIFKRVHQFKAGDLVHAQGAVFRIIEDARYCLGFSLCEPLHGPIDAAQARGEWVSGQTPANPGSLLQRRPVSNSLTDEA